MATKTHCDIKACQKTIDSEKDVHPTRLGDTRYDLCKKCHEDFVKFTAENLTGGTLIIETKHPVLTKPINLEEYMKQKGLQPMPYQPSWDGPMGPGFGQDVIGINPFGNFPYGTTTGGTKLTIPHEPTSDLSVKITSDNSLAPDEIKLKYEK